MLGYDDRNVTVVILLYRGLLGGDLLGGGLLGGRLLGGRSLADIF